MRGGQVDGLQLRLFNAGHHESSARSRARAVVNLIALDGVAIGVACGEETREIGSGEFRDCYIECRDLWDGIRVIIADSTNGGGRTQRHTAGGVGQCNGEALVLLDEDLARHVDGDGLARLTRSEGDHAGGQDTAHEVGGTGGIRTAARDGKSRRRDAANIASARRCEGEAGAAGLPLGDRSDRAADVERSVVIINATIRCRHAKRRIDRGRQRDDEPFLKLDLVVTLNIDRDDLAGLARGEIDRAAGHDASHEIGSDGAIGRCHPPGGAGAAAGIARAGDGEGEWCGARLAFHLLGRECRDGEHRGRDVVIQNEARGTGRAQADPGRGGGKGERYALITFHTCVTLDVDRDGLADLASGKLHRAAGQRCAHEVRRNGGRPAAARHGPARTRRARRIAAAGHAEGKRRAAGIALQNARPARHRKLRVIIADGAIGRGGADRGADRGGEGNGETLIRLQQHIRLDIDSDGPAGLSGREADRAGGQRNPHEVVGTCRASAAPGDRPGGACDRRRIPRARDRKGEGRRARLALGQIGHERRDEQHRGLRAREAARQHVTITEAQHLDVGAQRIRAVAGGAGADTAGAARIQDGQRAGHTVTRDAVGTPRAAEHRGIRPGTTHQRVIPAATFQDVVPRGAGDGIIAHVTNGVLEI